MGFHEDDELPVQRGDKVRIKKGTQIKTTHPSPAKKSFLSRRTYTVKVDHILNGMGRIDQDDVDWALNVNRYGIAPPSVRWVGTGGYWHEADINDVEKVTS